MRNYVSGHRRLGLVLLLLVLIAASAGVWILLRRDRGVDPASKVYEDVVSAFYVGLTALQTGKDDTAGEKLALATRLAPEEPAAWANLGLFYLRQQNIEAADENLSKARALAPQNARIEALLGIVRQRQGRFEEAIAHLRTAAQRDPQNLRVLYTLSQIYLQQNKPGAEAEVQRLMEAILAVQPDNIVALIERARMAAKRGDREALTDSVARLESFARAAGPEAVAQHQNLRRAALGPRMASAALPVAFMNNVLKPLYAYKTSVAAVQPGTDEPPGEPLTGFLVLPAPSPRPATPDTGLTFTSESLPTVEAGDWRQAGVIALDADGPPATFFADGRRFVLDPRRGARPSTVSLPFPGGPSATPPTPEGILGIETGYDFKTDLALAGAGGLRLFQQTKDTTFTDVTAKAALPTALVRGAYSGAWAADLEADGDLDLVLGSASGSPLALRNNGDGTWMPLRPFAGVSGLRAFAWADLDGDGDQEAALIDGAGALRVFTNERSGRFVARPVPADLGTQTAITVGDINSDGLFDLIVLRSDGAIVRVSDKEEGAAWETAEVARRDGQPDTATRLFVADLDNNGAVDLVASGASGARAWLSDSSRRLQPLNASLGARIGSIADLNGDGRLDLVGVSAEKKPVRLVSRGTKSYRWQLLRPHAFVGSQSHNAARETAFSQGQLINPFGVGGEMEVRAGLLFQKQLITGPLVHFGLGENRQADVVRVLWPNGTLRAEFGLDTDKSIAVEQRLNTSCPFLFAWDGRKIGFVTDCIWRSPLGLKINAQDTAGVMQTEDWVKIRGDQLVPRNGLYDLRITAELWETHFFDHLSLMTVDHPEGTEVWVDERLAFPQPPLTVHATKPPRPFARVQDDTGRDVSRTARDRDGQHLAGFPRGRFQGVTRDHWVEMELPGDAPRDRPLRLLAYGWIRPTNSSINVAIGQGRHDPPRGLSLEVADGKGGWTVARPGLGFPEGKVKTIVVNLDGIFRPGTPRRMRLRTNLEIYWDQLAWAEAVPAAPLKKRRLAARAELGYRGYSFITAADDRSPELPDYNRITSRSQRWRDLIGYYTRFGDVAPLLARVDDRYVIMNAGDEMRLTFSAPPPPPAGWVRDFVLIGDGWVKDGNYNTTFSKTVLPLPAHDRPDYTTPPGRLEDDPVYRRHASDWRTYHTRYVTPRALLGALRPAAGSAP